MGLIVASLAFLMIGVFIFLTSVNYAWVLWEKDRVDNLTKQIRPNEEDELFRRNQTREYTQSFDIKSIGRTGVSKANKALEKTMVAISDREYPTWITKAVDIFNQTRKDFVASVKTFIMYLVHLAKPDETIDLHDEYDDGEEEKEVDQAIARVKESTQQAEDMRAQRLEEQLEYSNTESVLDISRDTTDYQFDTKSPIRVTFNGQQSDTTASEFELQKTDSATIGLSSSKKQTNEAFEKLETRILDKLKQSGLNHYSIWIELGELYIKFEEKEKASEVFALVLKNTKSDKEKEIARNRLIGL